MLQRIWDPSEFLSDAGLRSLSKHHEDHPFVFGGAEVRYEPAESDVKIKGGNSNWRGPVWFPTTFLLIESLRKFDRANESRLRIRTAASPDVELTPREMARELADRMIGLFTKDANGRRRIYGGLQKFQEDPHWRDYLLFYEYFDGDTGAGLGRQPSDGLDGARRESDRRVAPLAPGGKIGVSTISRKAGRAHGPQLDRGAGRPGP